jgi:integrase
MPRKNLTEEGVAKLKPPPKGQTDFFDALVPGLILRVGYGGAKTWLARHYLKRRNKDGDRINVPTTAKLGRYPILKLKDARERARLFLTDPIKAKTEASVGSFRDVSENFIKRYIDEKQLRTKDEIVRRFNNLVFPHWENRQFRDIKRGDVANLLDRIVDNSGPREADKVLASIRKLMNWYATRHDDYVSVIVKGMGRYNAKDHERDRILTDDEIRTFWKACDGMDTFGALLKVLLLTAQRREKVLTMRWNDISGEVWTIPTASREKGNAGTLQLPPAVLDIIKAQSRIAGNPFVFPGRGNKSFNNFSKRTEELRDKFPDMPHWRLHDLRRTARSLLARAGVRPDVAERVLGHTLAGIENIYNRHSYHDEKADALIRLAALIERIVHPPSGNITDLADARQSHRA